MHEMVIIETVLKKVEEEAARRGMSNVSVVRLKIGKMEAFDRAHLDVCLRGFKGRGLINNTRYEVNEVPVVIECKACKECYRDSRFDDHEFAHQVAHAPALYMPPACPSCGSDNGIVVSGNEFELVSIDGV